MNVAKLSEKIRSYPMLFGALIGLLIFAWIIVMNTWFPWISEAWKRHNRLAQSVWFTAGLFGTWISRYWRLRRRGAFWASMGVFLVFHVSGVLYYATNIHPLILREWLILLTLESFVIVVFMSWSTRRFEHSGRRTE